VVISGVVIDADGYRLDRNRYLARLADDDGSPRFWPACQRLDVGDDAVGAWYVDYLSGQPVPLPGVSAAAELACELYKACQGLDCMLPAGTTKVIRQNVTIERAPFISWGLQKGNWATGLPLVDAFLAAYNPAGLRRRPSVWSPDLPGYGLPVDLPGT